MSLQVQIVYSHMWHTGGWLQIALGQDRGPESFRTEPECGKLPEAASGFPKMIA